MTTRMTDRAITRCPDCGSWRWWNRCFTCVPKVAQGPDDGEMKEAV